MLEFVYQNTPRYFAQVAGGMEKMAVEELSEWGAEQVSVSYRGCYFNADKESLYRINYRARLINRVLAPLKMFRCHSTNYLYKQARSVAWTDFFSSHQTFAVFASVSHSHIRHSQYAARRLKDAIVDSFREQVGKRPSVERHTPDVWFNLHIVNNRATISLDTSGGSLHRRGYRHQSIQAPMQETLAAAIIRLTGWQGLTPLYDPMCGSGTLLAEALMHCANLPAACLRSHFGFEHLPDFDKNLWDNVKRKAEKTYKTCPPGLISGSDISSDAIRASRMNLSVLPGGEQIELQATDFENIDVKDSSTLVCNPPYGIRMGDKKEIGCLYKRFGDFLKQRCKNSTAFVYFGDRALLPKIGLKPSWKKPLVNGALDGRLAKFELY